MKKIYLLSLLAIVLASCGSVTRIQREEVETPLIYSTREDISITEDITAVGKVKNVSILFIEFYRWNETKKQLKIGPFRFFDRDYEEGYFNTISPIGKTFDEKIAVYNFIDQNSKLDYVTNVRYKKKFSQHWCPRNGNHRNCKRSNIKEQSTCKITMTMNKYIYLILGLFFITSCSNVKLKTMNTAEMRFSPMPAIPTGDYEAEATINFKRNIIRDREVLNNYKQGTLSSQIEPIYVNLDQKTLRGKIRTFLLKYGSIRSGLKIASDPTYDLAVYNLTEKYPYVDYWTNIRISREVQGRKSLFVILRNLFSSKKVSPYIKSGPEKVKIVATGIDIMTDAEYEAFKKTPSFNNMKQVLFPLGNAPK